MVITGIAIKKIIYICTSSVQRLTGVGPDNLEELREMALEAEDDEQNDEASDQSDDSEEDEEPSDHGQAGPCEEE